MGQRNLDRYNRPEVRIFLLTSGYHERVLKYAPTERPADEPFFDIDTDIRPDTDPTIFNRRALYAQDEGGEYGSVFDTEEDTKVPEPE